MAYEFWNGGNHAWVIRLRRRLWDWEAPLLDRCCEMIQSRLLDAAKIDRVLWRPCPHKEFTTKLAYKWWRKSTEPMRATSSKKRLVTKARRAQWLPNAGVDCPFGCHEAEMCNRLFGSCPIARLLWSRFSALSPDFVTVYNVDSVWKARARWADCKDKSRIGGLRRSIVLACTWALWLTRNEVVFHKRRFYFENLWHLAKLFIVDWGMHLSGASVVQFERDRLVMEE
ncbi:hypothetical protein QJS10_CPB18g00716 [Acorus calamus]|uniref:Reverse transcriptase zinc-binding domain-containing protein n=1 Tax=Acorus calamus TaxID=4465 RepID=A0AAV9CNZ3_ACOCL|nr:hypothetical protein QJS10_CPB18g00716 [Acorus calamus]